MQSQYLRTAAIGALAGAAGGLAEIGWIGIYASAMGIDAGLVARGVTDSVRLGDLTAFPVTAGIAVHMLLAGALGIAIAFALRSAMTILRGASGKYAGAFTIYAMVLAVLTVIWAVNFFAVLPQINPPFVHIVPYGASLVSKLLFGIAAAWFFRLTRLARPSLVRS